MQNRQTQPKHKGDLGGFTWLKYFNLASVKIGSEAGSSESGFANCSAARRHLFDSSGGCSHLVYQSHPFADVQSVRPLGWWWRP